MTYKACLEFLFNRFPQFQREGQKAYKPGLQTSLTLAEAFGHPERRLRCIHIAGTNGKGSTAHTLAAVLQSAGYHTGLYTSPHLVDFRERMRIDGATISEAEVTDFVERYQRLELPCAPSFFELTTIMAFEWFARRNVDVVVLECGLGGRLDTTNIIERPLISVVTNISLDHVALLGHTRAAIASEKAGIIKAGCPVVVGEKDEETARVFADKAREVGAPLVFAPEAGAYVKAEHTAAGRWLYSGTCFGDVTGELAGDCQPQNAATTLTVLKMLRSGGLDISDEAVKMGFASVTELTGLMGRWMKVGDSPLTICDTGHNVGGWKWIVSQLNRVPQECMLHLVVGFVNDKDISGVLGLIAQVRAPRRLYFTQASVPRALPAEELAHRAAEMHLDGKCAESVEGAVSMARAEAAAGDVIFVGGSTFVVADFLKKQSGKTL